MIDVLSQEYVRTARAKGLSQLRVVWQHSFKNAIVPVITVVGAQFGQLLGGAIVCETVFAWPGVASLTVFAIRQSDFPVVQAGVTILGLFIVVVNMCVDLLAAYLDPRISIQ
jgi:peptide/nickel transport system permease protein